MLKVFEAFSGVGAQHMALKNIGKKFEIVATSEIDVDAILSYFSVHNNKNINYSIIPKINRIELLNKLNLNINKIKEDKLEKLLIADYYIKNLGDIKKIKVELIPDHDLFTYSFPCQDISSIGTGKGLEEGSGTRSSLLWECQKIIKIKRPKYLVMENVKSLVQGKNKNNFFKWIEFLKLMGYQSQWKIFDSQDYGIPQRRPRVILISKLGTIKTNLLKDDEFIVKELSDVIDNKQKKWIEFYPKGEIKGEIKENEILFLDDRDWKMNGVMISKICSTQRSGRTGLKFIKKKKGKLFERKLTALECCRLMGFDDEVYLSMKNMGLSDTAVMKICGNSIVVPVLEMVFKNIFEEDEIDD